MNSPALETDDVMFAESGQTLSRLTGLPFLRASQSGRSQATTFVLASDLPQRWRRPGLISVLETSLGFGARLMATLCLWRKTPRHPDSQLHYTAIEPHPLSAADMRHVLQEAGFDVADFQSLLSDWPHLCAGVHRIPLPENVTLTLFLGDTRTALSELSTCFDTIFLTRPNGTGQDKQIASVAVSTRLAWLAGPGCHLVSDITFQSVKQVLGPALPAAAGIRFPEEAAKHIRLKPVDSVAKADIAESVNDDIVGT